MVKVLYDQVMTNQVVHDRGHGFPKDLSLQGAPIYPYTFVQPLWPLEGEHTQWRVLAGLGDTTFPSYTTNPGDHPTESIRNESPAEASIGPRSYVRVKEIGLH